MTSHTSTRVLITLTALAAAGAAAGCDDTTGPDVLDRERVLAVRVSPPHLAPDEVAPIDVLVGHADGTVEIVAPDRVAVDLPDAVSDRMLGSTEQGWTVTCPPAEALAQLRAAQELGPDDPVMAPLAVGVDLDGEPLTATKAVYLGSEGDNPRIAGVSLAGIEPDEAGAFAIRAGAEVEIAAEGAEVDSGEPSYAWYSSVGDIDLYESERATLTAGDDPTTGALVLVVRDGRGGVTWTLLDVRVE